MQITQTISQNFNAVKNKQLEILRTINDNKIIENILTRINTHVTKLEINLGSLFNEDLLDSISERLIPYCEEHKVTIRCNQSDQVEKSLVGDSLFIYKFSDFNFQEYTVNQESIHLVLFDATVNEKLINRLRARRNILLIKCENEMEAITNAMSDRLILMKVYRNKERFIHNELKIVYKILRRRNSILCGNITINKGREISLLSKNARALQIESGQVKQQISLGTKKVLLNFENEIEKLYSIEHPEYKKLSEEIDDFVGFDDNIDGKAIVFRFPKDFVEEFKQKCATASSNVFKSSVKSIDDKLNDTQSNLINGVREEDNNTLQLNDHHTQTDGFDKTIFKDTEVIRHEDRKAEHKGRGSIFAALKTPIFALFPLIMIARFIPSSDVGAIAEHFITYENQSVVVVSEMPEKYDNNITKFIAAVDDALNNGDLDNKDTGKDLFKHSIGERGRKNIEYSKATNGDGSTYVIFPVYSDREMAAKILMDNVLTIQMRLNIVSEMKKIPKILGPFEDYFGMIFFGLIFWFIYSKNVGMKEHNNSTRLAETLELKNMKHQEIQKFIKLSQTQARNQIKLCIKNYLESTNRKIEQHYTSLIHQEEKDRIRELKMFKSRERLFQIEINNITTSQKSLYDTGKAYSKSINNSI